MSVTFKDVAELAGVSTQTVSRVTNGSSSVAEETRKKVLAAIDELGYVPNKGAQILSRAKPSVVGLITLDIGLHGVSLIANSIRQQAKEMGYGTSFSVVTTPDYEHILAAVRDLRAQKIEDAIINVHMSRHDAETLAAKFNDMHFVFIDVPPETSVNIVCADHFEGACSAAELMIQQGRQQLLLITGPQESNASQLRLKGWQKVIDESDARVVDIVSGDWQADSGYMLIKQALTRSLEFDAVLVASDQMALGVLRGLSEFAVKVPEQVAVAGFDDTADSAFFIPPLTTVRQDFVTIGKEAVEFVLDDDNKPGSSNKKHSIYTQLVERQSTSVKQDAPEYDKEQIKQLLNQIGRLLP